MKHSIIYLLLSITLITVIIISGCGDSGGGSSITVNPTSTPTVIAQLASLSGLV